MSDFQILSLNEIHDKEFVAMCFNCKNAKCQEHPKYQEHLYKKLNILKDQWTQKLKNAVNYLNSRGNKTYPQDEQYQKIFQMQLQSLKEMEQEFMGMIKQMFGDLQNQYTKIYTEFMKSNKLKSMQLESVNWVNGYLDLIQNSDKDNLLKTLEQLEENQVELECSKLIQGEDDFHKLRGNQFFLDPPTFNYHEKEISKLQEMLKKTIAISFQNDQPLQQSTQDILPWFIEDSNQLLTYNVVKQKVILNNIKYINQIISPPIQNFLQLCLSFIVEAFSFENVDRFTLKCDNGVPFIVPFKFKTIVRKNNQIVMVGGQHPQKLHALNEINYFDPSNNKMLAYPHMQEERYGHCVIYNGFKTVSNKKKDSQTIEYLYILGGKNDHARLKSCERFSFQDKKITGMPEMPIVKIGASGILCQKQIYVFGGVNEQSKLSPEILRFSMQEMEWQVLQLKSSMQPALDQAVFQLNKNQIMILGGAKFHNDQTFHFCQDLQLFNIDTFAIQSTVKIPDEFPQSFLGDMTIIKNDTLYMLARCQRQSQSFGPQSRNLLQFNLNNLSWRFDQLLKFE